jgi:sugar/nucleoside kinase (ribokinase family)
MRRSYAMPMRITTLGDLLLDVIVRLEQPLVPGDDTVGVTHMGAGGQAANVAAWAASLGARARVVAKVGADPAGGFVAQELRGRDVELCGPLGTRTGVVVSLASAGDRTMASDRGSAPDLEPDELAAAWFEGDVLHLSGYALARAPIAASAERAVELARGYGATVSLDLSAVSLVDETYRRRAVAISPDIVFATQREYEALPNLDTRWVVKHGADGLTVDGEHWPALDVGVVDTTGAGDALAAGFLVGGPELGLEAAARCCTKMGAMP